MSVSCENELLETWVVPGSIADAQRFNVERRWDGMSGMNGRDESSERAVSEGESLNKAAKIPHKMTSFFVSC